MVQPRAILAQRHPSSLDFVRPLVGDRVILVDDPNIVVYRLAAGDVDLVVTGELFDVGMNGRRLAEIGRRCNVPVFRYSTIPADPGYFWGDFPKGTHWQDTQSLASLLTLPAADQARFFRGGHAGREAFAAEFPRAQIYEENWGLH